MNDSTPKEHALPVLGNSQKSCACEAAPEHGYGKSYWRSIEEKLGSPEFEEALQREFPVGATEAPQGFERREFLSLLGASLALAGLSACSNRPAEKILPYTRTPPNLAPGNPLHFATAFELDGYANGLLVTSWEGRPTKIEGNPDHPYGKGATGLYEQAAILGLYDPHRAGLVKEKSQARAWQRFIESVAEHGSDFKKDGGGRIRFLMEPSASPLLGEMRSRVLQMYPNAKFYSYGFDSEDNARAGAELAFGRRLDARFDVERADVILSLDADFLNPVPRQLRHPAGFSARRVPNAGPMNRLYVAEPALTITGSMADHRLRMKASEIQGLAMAVLAQLPGYAGLQQSVGKLSLSQERARWVNAVAKDLQQHRGHSLVVAGHRQPPLVHALAYAINDALGNGGQTVRYFDPILLDDRTGPESLKALVAEIQRGQVETLVITARNPVYASPADLGLAEALSKVPNVIYRGLFEDETAQRARWFIPATHFLETWGDARAVDGSVSLVQPLIAPLFSGFSEVDILAAFLGEGERGTYVQLRAAWQKRAGANFDRDWDTWLAEGVVPGSPLTAQSPSIQSNKVLTAARSAPTPSPTELEVNYAIDSRVHDGRFANNAWLQELADPISKITWDNAALVSPATAKRLGVESGDVVELSLGQRRVVAPIWVAPGHADNSVTLPLGYGRTAAAEPVARKVGFNAFALMRFDASGFDRDLTVNKVGLRHEFAQTQTHWSMSSRPDDKEVKPRPLALEQTLEELHKDPGLAAELRQPLPTIQPPVKYEGYQWAMAVDLSRCIGCSACVMACQAENNIPVVGKAQVRKGREMHWLRIDRYFEGTLEDPSMITQPVACVHCEAAPCEYVCPVNATVHSDEGLNEMIYNRCVGTRYCSNNCPYKVRRFNFLHWTGNKSALEAMGSNPDVTVRARGVMEKCTYCVQRIERVRIASRIENRPIKDGEIKTACQQACPANVISFGTLSDANSQVSKLHKDARRYDLLHDLNTRPRTAYLLRIRNPNPELA